MFRVFASNDGGGISVILETTEAALRKLAEFREAASPPSRRLTPPAPIFEDAELAVMAQGSGTGAAP